MAATSDRVDAILKRYGTTYAQQAGIRLADKPAPLYQLLVLATLLSARSVRTLMGMPTLNGQRTAGVYIIGAKSKRNFERHHRCFAAQ